jgi:uncharacterized protein (DUF433 family)
MATGERVLILLIGGVCTAIIRRRNAYARGGALQSSAGDQLTLLIMLDRIRIDPQICEGKPTIRGMRITVDFVLKLIGDGYTADDIVREYPELEKEDVYQAAKYGAWLASEKTTAIA